LVGHSFFKYIVFLKSYGVSGGLILQSVLTKFLIGEMAFR